MVKLTGKEVFELIRKHNKENNIHQQYADKNPLRFVVVFKESNWKEKYSLESRSYSFRSDEKYFLPDMIGKSWYGDALDGSDDGVRLDWYNWEPEYYYQT